MAVTLPYLDGHTNADGIFGMDSLMHASGEGPAPDSPT